MREALQHKMATRRARITLGNNGACPFHKGAGSCAVPDCPPEKLATMCMYLYRQMYRNILDNESW